MTITSEATLTAFLLDPKAIVEQLDRRDVVLHRRNAADLHLSLRSRVESDGEAVGFLARLLGRVLADDELRGRLADAVAAIPWVMFLPADEREVCSMAALGQVLIEWKATAAIHADPALAIELKRPIRDIGPQIAEPRAS